MKLDEVVPFGRTYHEYVAMFNLTDAELGKKIIGIGDGPASFNAEMYAMGRRVISVDPVYRFQSSEIESQFYTVLDGIIAQVENTLDDWVWDYHRSPSDLKTTRVKALNLFIKDYNEGKKQGRYVNAELPALDIDDKHYDLALCSHLLFLYSDQLNYEFHYAAIREMLRIAHEVRVFPLVTLNLERSPHLDRLLDELNTNEFEVEIQRANYEFQRGGNELLRVVNRVMSPGSD